MKTPPPLSPELEALLAPHRSVLPLPASVETRALTRAAVAPGPELGGGLRLGPSGWALAAAGGVIVALGAASYAAARSWMTVPATEEPALSAPVAAPEARQPRGRAVVASDDAPKPVAPLAPARPRRAVSKASVAAVRPTNAELQLLREARQDVTRGEFEGALRAIADHVRRFRDGALVEEREALRVKSLAGLGRDEEAHRAAARFRARFPDSVFLSTFDRLKGANR